MHPVSQTGAPTDAHTVITPHGTVLVRFPEDGGSTYEGSDGAIQYLHHIMATHTNGIGATMNPESLEPVELEGFCQPPGAGITVIPPLADMLEGSGDVRPMESMTMDDANGLMVNEAAAMREQLSRERAPMARLPIMAAILAMRAAVDSGETTTAPRQRMASLYEFNESRKPAQRKRENVAAMALLSQIDSGAIDAASLTMEQKQTLAKYSGTGGALIGADGKKGSAYEYYTPAPVAQGIWDALAEMGFAGGKVLDPCAGTGIFGATAPTTAVVDAVELNETSGRVQQLVNDGPGYKTVVSPFEAIAANTPDETYDAVVTNVPFGGVADRGGNQLLDKKYQKEPLQNYFILRSLEKLRGGGIAAFITPPRCVSGKDGVEVKMRLAASQLAEFIGAYRLPNSVFGTASADTMTDVMFFRKHSKETRDQIQELRAQNPDLLTQAKVLFDEFIEGRYFLGEGRRFVLGEMTKAKGQWGEVDVLTTKATVGEIGKMLRKLPDSRIDWDMLGAAETSPIIYNEGDTVYQSGQCLKLQDGNWVPVADTAGDLSQATAVAMQNMASPYAAWEARIDFAQAKAFATGMQATGQWLDMPGWLRDVMAQTAAWDAGDQTTYWTAGLVGMSVQQVMEERAGDEGLNYLEEYAALSDAMQVNFSTAKGAHGKITGRIKLGLKALTTHYSKKAGFSALWRGDIQAQVTNEHAATAQGTFEGLRYQLKSAWVPLDDAKAIYGEDFDPHTDDAWCLSADGSKVTKADDYYTGNYADFLAKIDAEIAGTTDEKLKAKLLRQKNMAAERIERVDVSKLEFNLFSPHVTAEEKTQFLSTFVSPFATVVYEDGKARPDIQIKTNKDSTDRDKLLNRVGDYLKNGTITLGGTKLDMDDAKALAELRKMVRTANEQFNGWARSNTAIQARLQALADDPTRLRFERVEDTDPLQIPGMNPALKLHGYQNAFVRAQSREFGGGNGFDVGLGKTFTALAAAQYVQSIGVKKKTVFVVPGSVLSNWRKEAMGAYTTIDDCLFIGLRDKKGGGFTVNPSAYDEDLNRIRENRHSKIFMTSEAFERLRLRDETISRFGDHMRSVDNSFAEVQDKKQDEKNKGKAADFIAILSDKKGGAPYLEDLGIDSLVSDEAHAYKNSSEVSEFKGGKYLSLAPSAKRGIDMQAKAWFIRGMSTAGDGVLLLTASPITNSPLEIYSMLSLAVGHQRVNDLCLGVKGADQFMNMMCQVDSETDVTMDGITRETNVFTGLNNVSALRKAVNTVFTIKDADDVGAQIVVPEADEQKSPIGLPSETTERLKLYKEAFRYAIDVISEKPDPRGSEEAYDAVQAHFGESMELIGHPFNLINKMTMLIADPELDQRSSFYSFPETKAQLALSVVDKFNAKKITEDRARPAPITEESSIVSRKVTKDGDTGKETVTLKIHAKAYIVQGNRVQIDTIDQDTQSAFEDIAEAAGLDLDVTIPPKLAAMLDNYKNEQATPRGVIDGSGERSPIVKQIVFCDILPLHNKIKRILSKHAGVPAGAIAIITGQTNNKPEQILEVQDGFNAQGDGNKYRCVIANEKAEVGINLQKGTQAIHHLTIGWTPDSLQQRNGRGVRQGNHTAKVTVYHYDADGTFDSAKRVMVNKKADWIGQVMDASGGNKVAITGGMSAEQLRMLIDTVGDADAMRRVQETMAAKEAESRASNNREKQLINLDTIKKQRDYIDGNPDAIKSIVRKVVGLHQMRRQSAILADKIANPKSSPTAIARNEGLLAEMQARFAGLAKQVDASATITYERYNTPDRTVGVIEFLDLEGKKGRGDGFTNDEELAEKLNGVRYSAYKLAVTDGGPAHREWELETGLAERMLAEATKSFEAQGEEAGAFPAGIAALLAQGKGMVYAGQPLVTGTFLRIPQSNGTSALAVYVHGSGEIYGGGQMIRAATATGLTADRRLTQTKITDAVIALPGSPEYRACMEEAAAIEDGAAAIQKPTTIYSDAVPAVAGLRKSVATRKYSISRSTLPAPYFPYVISEQDAVKVGATVLARIFESQKSVVLSTDGYEFVAELTAGIVEGADGPTRSEALQNYAKANGLKLSLADMRDEVDSGIEYGMLAAKAANLSSNPLSAVLARDFDSLPAIDAAIVDWLGQVLPEFDWTSHLGGERIGMIRQVVTFGTPNGDVEYAEAKHKVTGEAAPASEGNPNDIVGVTGNTMEWKARIKMVAGKYKWDGRAGAWNIYRSAWNELVRRYPDATKELQIVKGTAYRL